MVNRVWRTIEVKKKNKNNEEWYTTKALIDESLLYSLKGCNRKTTRNYNNPQINKLGVAFCCSKHYFAYLKEHNILISRKI